MLDVDAQRRAHGPRSGQPIDDARAALEHHSDALIGRIRAVDRIMIGEIIRRLDLVAAEALAGKGLGRVAERRHQALWRR